MQRKTTTGIYMLSHCVTGVVGTLRLLESRQGQVHSENVRKTSRCVHFGSCGGARRSPDAPRGECGILTEPSLTGSPARG